MVHFVCGVLANRSAGLGAISYRLAIAIAIPAGGDRGDWRCCGGRARFEV